ncbi:MAG: L-glutamate gamma-semialdehyde dehydrogenase [Euzebyaceae bacterium]|jgi:1-pyrroline-5-carboxylate dehydrogenase|nr:L-glutamate gamma-semialdehyde dehydrogenase [Euzebyaceae bacterium]
MSTGQFRVPVPRNEPVRAYEPGSPQRTALENQLAAMAKERIEAPMNIGGRDVRGSASFEVAAPHDHDLVLADVFAAEPAHVTAAIAAAADAAADWAAWPWQERAGVFLRAAELLAGPWRDVVNAATMLGQSKSVYQAEIDAACELIDFWRYNVAFAERIYSEQPESSPGVWNRMDHRPLEGFVLALTPFNFTAIAGNLPTAPALMGCVTVWKPSEKQALSAHHLMGLLRAAGLPDGVVNLVHGDGAMVSDVAMAHRDFAGLHFTGSTTVFRGLWRKTAEHIDAYRNYPRIVGETGGKDFVLAHPSAGVDELVVALGRGAFEYQGQKCSAASRAYVPQSLWPAVRDGLADLAGSIPMGDVADLSNFMGAVIDERAYRRLTEAVASARDAGAQVLAGGGADEREGWFVEPTVLVTGDPRSDTMVRELFGPVLTVFVYDDREWDATLDLVEESAPYALTGAVFADDRSAVDQASVRLRHAAGNFYVNDKPTGAVVGQQPFGGARASGTNDKAGSVLNLLRWVSPRTLKETFVPPTDWRYPHMGP